MPAPFMVVTFEDADGDEFPMRVEGMWLCHEHTKLLVEAGRLLGGFSDRGEMTPTYPLEPRARVELVGGDHWEVWNMQNPNLHKP